MNEGNGNSGQQDMFLDDDLVGIFDDYVPPGEDLPNLGNGTALSSSSSFQHQGDVDLPTAPGGPPRRGSASSNSSSQPSRSQASSTVNPGPPPTTTKSNPAHDAPMGGATAAVPEAVASTESNRSKDETEIRSINSNEPEGRRKFPANSSEGTGVVGTGAGGGRAAEGRGSVGGGGGGIEGVGSSEGVNDQFPRPTWHREAAHKPYRQSMIKEIALLLQARKKSEPSKEWMHQLPYKAKNLEERLYRTAASLDAYLDRGTLKHRLKRLAKTIVKQYRVSGSRGSSLSISSSAALNSIARGVSSSDSIRSLPVPAGISREGSIDSVSTTSTHQGLEGTSSIGAQKPGSMSSSAETHDAASSASAISSDGIVVQGESPGPSLVSPTLPSESSDISELERQKAVNERLQQQIMENIRQQELLVRNLQARAQATEGQLGGGGNTQANHEPPNGTAVGGLHQPGNLNPAMSGPSLHQTTIQGNSNNMTVMHGNNVANIQHLMGASGSTNLFMTQAAFINGRLNSNSNLQQNAQASALLQNLPPGVISQAPGMGALMGMANNNLLVQPQLQGGIAASTNQQLSALRGSGLLNSGMSGMTPVHAPQANAMGSGVNQMSGFNPTMPPPNMVPASATTFSQTAAMRTSSHRSAGGTSAADDTTDSTPLSPGSFNW